MAGGQALYYFIGIAISVAIGVAAGSTMAKEQNRPQILHIAIGVSLVLGILVGYALNVFMAFIDVSATRQ